MPDPNPKQARPQLHSRAEAELFATVTPCPHCHGGAMLLDAARTTIDAATGLMHVVTACTSCGESSTFDFTAPTDESPADANDLYPVISHSNEPSQVIDVGQWITLASRFSESALRITDKIEARRTAFRAALCLEEAIKFYSDNELPIPEAVFTESTRRRLREHPQQFARQRLVEMRSKLPRR